MGVFEKKIYYFSNSSQLSSRNEGFVVVLKIGVSSRDDFIVEDQFHLAEFFHEVLKGGIVTGSRNCAPLHYFSGRALSYWETASVFLQIFIQLE